MADWRSPLTSAVVYRDPKAALKFLEAAFGFELFMLIEDAEGSLVHSEMRFGDAAIMVGYEWSDDYRSPASVGGKVTQSVHIRVDTDIDAHCERARAAGMEIVMAPADQFYGARTYRCRDPEGHIWTIAQEVRAVSREEAEAATGLKITGWV
ncbi:MAG: VOC family protein [Phenylobacterium sp.]|uniref:VOC family protein n=1 Tax=Phenylobacterium sp. TaxID=1871053 RepID=UPI001A287DD0|nr:VOC family protein [Phenylobacterium sp.]MBJ7413101.1 VOC family protein [Phenylobacterium sp.]